MYLASLGVGAGFGYLFSRSQVEQVLKRVFTKLCDLNEDGMVDVRDVSIVTKALGSKPGDSNWNPKADVNGDGVVDENDRNVVNAFFGLTYEEWKELMLS